MNTTPNPQPSTSPASPVGLQSVQVLAAQCAAITQAATGSVPDQLAVCLAAGLADAWVRRSPAEPGSVPSLRPIEEFAPLLSIFRRGDQYAQWLQIQREWITLAHEKHQDHLAAQKAASEPSARRPRPDGGFTKETLAQIERDLNLF